MYQTTVRTIGRLSILAIVLGLSACAEDLCTDSCNSQLECATQAGQGEATDAALDACKTQCDADRNAGVVTDEQLTCAANAVGECGDLYDCYEE